MHCSLSLLQEEMPPLSLCCATLQVSCRAWPDARGDGRLAELLAGTAPTKPPQHDDKGTRRAGTKEQKRGAASLLIQRAVGTATG